MDTVVSPIFHSYVGVPRMRSLAEIEAVMDFPVTGEVVERVRRSASSTSMTLVLTPVVLDRSRASVTVTVTPARLR